jgi:hypothetical protein
VSCAGLVPVMRLAEQVDLSGLVAGRVHPDLVPFENSVSATQPAHTR